MSKEYIIIPMDTVVSQTYDKNEAVRIAMLHEKKYNKNYIIAEVIK